MYNTTLTSIHSSQKKKNFKLKSMFCLVFNKRYFKQISNYNDFSK